MRRFLGVTCISATLNAALWALLGLLIIDVNWMPNIVLGGIDVRFLLNILFLAAYGWVLGFIYFFGVGGLLLIGQHFVQARFFSKR